ncbi:MAG: heparin lyase I family protein [Planctomycetota bacterium]
MSIFKKPINSQNYSLFFSICILVSLASLLAPNASAQQTLLWSNNGTNSGWDGQVGYTGGYSVTGGKLKMYLPRSSGKHRGDKRKYNVGGSNLNNKTIKYTFQLRSPSLIEMRNRDMNCWYFQSMMEATFSGNRIWKPLVALTYNGVNDDWELNTYSGSMQQGPVRRWYSLGGSASSDNNQVINWAVEVKYRTNNTGYVFVWRNGTRVLDQRNIPTYFNDATNATIERSHAGWMHYLVKVQGERWGSPQVGSVTAYFDNFRVYRVN